MNVLKGEISQRIILKTSVDYKSESCKIIWIVELRVSRVMNCGFLELMDVATGIRKTGASKVDVGLLGAE